MGLCDSKPKTDAEEIAADGGESKGGLFASAGDTAQVAQEAFVSTVGSLAVIAINGYPLAIRSTLARRNELLRKMSGDPEKAVEKVMSPPMGKSLIEEAKEFLLVLVPYVGVPAAIVYPLWKQLRRACLVAGLLGHNLQEEETQARIICDVAGVKAGAIAGGKLLEKAVQALWKALAGPKARLLPVGKVVSSLADIEKKANEVMLEDFRQGQKEITEEEYQDELDGEPTAKEFLQCVQEKGKQTMEQVIEKGREMTKNRKAGDLKVAAEQAAGKVKEAAAGLAEQAKGMLSHK